MRCKKCGKNGVPEGSTFCNWCGNRIAPKPKNEINVPKPKQVSSGRWYINLRIKGESISITEDTEAKCVAKARAIKAGMLQADPKTSLTLRTAIDNYIARREAVLSPSTVRSYKSVAKNCFQAAMDKPLSFYDQAGWQRLVSAESHTCSPKTLKNAWSLVNAVLKEELGKAYTVRLPQIVPTRETKFLEPSEIHIFCDAAVGTRVEIAALLALHSLRRSELLAVTWEDVDLEQRCIHVRGAMVFDSSQKLVENKANKNKTSRRTVPIMMDRLYDLLKEQQQPSGPVVTLHPNTVRDSINRICEKNNLPQVGVHGLRHSFASLAAHIGMPEKTTMEIGGWANDATMKKIYTHALKTDRENYSKIMTDYYNKSEEAEETTALEGRI